MSSIQKNQSEPTGLGGALSVPELKQVQLAWGIGKIMFWGWVVTRNTVAFTEGGAWAVGLMLLCHVLPGALITPIYAVFADRIGPLRGLAILAWVRMIALAASALILFLDGPLYALIVVAVIEGFGSEPHDSIHMRVLPWLARTPSELTAANGLTELLRMNGILLGPAIAVVLLMFADAGVAFTVFAVGSLVTVLLFYGLGDKVPSIGDSGVRAALKRLDEGRRTITCDGDISLLFLLGAFLTACIAALQVYSTELAIDLLNLGDSGPSMLNAMFGIGGLIGGVASIRFAGRHDLVLPWVGGVTLMGLSYLLMGTWIAPVMAFGAMALTGVGLVFYTVSGTSLMQRAIKPNLHASTFGLNFLISSGGFGLGGMMGSALIAGFSLETAIFITGGLIVLTAAMALPSLKRVAERANAHSEELELLRESAVFKSLPVAPLEAIAESLERLSPADGEILISQNDPGEHYYLIAAGTVKVSIDGEIVQHLERPDSFGEIALLEDLPRSATVTCGKQCILYRLNREAFLAALTGNPESHREALVMARARLAVNAQRPSR